MEHIPKQVEESGFDVADGGIFESEKTNPTYSSGVVFSDSNLPPSVMSKFRFFNLFGYSTWRQWRVFVLVMLLGAAGLLFSAAALAVDAKKTSVIWLRSNLGSDQ